jgi:eukaryotic-like serine/threonine-protein kinase
MPAEITSHPSAADLRSFAHGRLGVMQMAEVERHIAQCDSCCRVLESVPEDTLVQLAREAATEAFRAGEAAAPRSEISNRTVPAELVEHSRYKILGLVGLGGMGAVYKAEHRLMERLVALKVISRSFTANPQAVERFRREVKAAARLAHANIVTAHDAEQAGELHFLVMEFVDGVGLDRLVAKQGTPTISQACGLIRQAALGLQHAHEKGMVHRDIKPANLMVTRKGQVKILDFGLARLAELVASESQQLQPGEHAPADATAAGMILGTPDYIAPEQAADSRNADIRADIYSLGCTFYFLLTGEPPFPKGTVMQKLAAHMHEMPPPLALKRSDIPADVSAILLRMMAKKPEERYQTPAEVAKDLTAVQKGTGGTIPKLDPLKPPDDFFAGLDLAAMPAGPAMPLNSLTSISSPPRKPHSSGDIADWFADNKRPVAIAAAIAGCLLLAVLGVWGAGKFLGGDKPYKSVQKQEYANAKPVERQVVPVMSPEIPAGSPHQPSPSKPRVLFCVPHNGLFEQDFYEVLPTLSANASVTVASTVGGPCNKYGGGVSEVTPQVVIGRDSISAQDYDAIIFTGANTGEFHQEPTERLVSEFVNNGKLITAICYGQEVLAHHKLLRPGVRVANSSYMTEKYKATGCSPVDSPVVRHENLITAQDPVAGPAFAKMILDAIPRKSP